MAPLTISENSGVPGNAILPGRDRETWPKMINAAKTFVRHHGMFFALAASIAGALKYHYSKAGSDELAWILLPTAALVERISGIPFAPEAHTGFVNYARQIVIAPVCAGVNFLIIAFSMTAFSGLRRIRQPKLKWLWLISSLTGAYGLTILVNALRILVSIYSYDAGIAAGWLTAPRIHRLEGVVVYFFFLCLFYRIIDAVLSPFDGGRQGITTGRLSSDSWRRAVAGLVPLFWYGLITLATPLLNGAPARDAARFAEHGVTVVFACLVVWIVLVFIQGGWKRFRGPKAKRP